jgi:hypothetical protein
VVENGSKLVSETVIVTGPKTTLIGGLHFGRNTAVLHDQIKRVMVSFDADQLLDEERGGPKFFEPVPGPLSNLVVAITSTTS